MKPTIKSLAVALACASLWCTGPAQAQTAPATTTTTTTTTATSTSTPDSRLVSQYSTLAGSPQNAQSLISGLRTGTPVTLITTTIIGTTSSTTTFTPATSKLSTGNINIALSLAKASLAQQGITEPTPAQLSAALNGGTITTTKGTVTLGGVLSARAAGQGWGKIANTMGFKLGSVVSASKTDKAGKKDVATNGKKSEHASAGKSDKASVASAKSGSGGESHASSGGNGGGNGGGKGGGGNGGGGGGGGGGGKK